MIDKKCAQCSKLCKQTQSVEWCHMFILDPNAKIPLNLARMHPKPLKQNKRKKLPLSRKHA